MPNKEEQPKTGGTRVENFHFTEDTEKRRLHEFNMLVRFTKDVLPEIEDLTLLTRSEKSKSGLVVGFIQDGENRITVPVGIIAPEGYAWTMISKLPTSAERQPVTYTHETIPTRVIQEKNPQQNKLT